MQRGIVSLALSLMVCSACATGMGTGTIANFRADANAVERFDRESGPLGAYAMAAFLGIASRYLNRPFGELEIAVRKRSPVHNAAATSDVALAEGRHLIVARDSQNKYRALRSLTFHNQGSGRAVVFLETFNEDLKPQGFAYIQLEPGDKYVHQHNEPVTVASAAAAGAVAGGVVLGGATLFDEIILDGLGAIWTWAGGYCDELDNLAMPDECVGVCDPGECVATSYQDYGPWGSLGAEPATCGCR